VKKEIEPAEMISCECIDKCSAFTIDYDSELKIYSLLLYINFFNRQISFWRRFKMIIEILKTGQASCMDVIFTPTQARQVRDFINKTVEEDSK